jgi:hypothetical protein
MESLSHMKNNFYTPLDWWIDYSVWLMLQYKFMYPAKLIGYNDDMQNYLKQFSLNGIKTFSICR